MVYTFSSNWGQGFQNKEHRHRNTFPKQVVDFHFVNTNNIFFLAKTHTHKISSLMPSSHWTILARFFTRRQVLINRRQMPDIRGKSVLVHVRDNRAVWIIKDSIWGHRRCVTDTREIFGMLNIWSGRRFTILLCEWVLTENDISDDIQPMREQDTGQLEVQGGLFLMYFLQSHLQTTCIHFGIRIYRSGRLDEDEGFFL